MPARRILITDDEALFRSSAAESLRARFRGVEVLEAEDGAAALAILERLPVDVLITDLQMPRVGGVDLVARISSHRMPIQIIVVSAYITDQTRLTLDDLGALVCVDKPIDLELLHRAVERMLSVPRAHVSGVTLAGFVQLLEMEHQTCALRIVSPDGVGTLVFEHGRLVDAWTGELFGDQAALAILHFQDTTLDVIGALRSEVRRVTQPLSFLLLESARRADEREPEQVAGQWEIVSLDDEAASALEKKAAPPDAESERILNAAMEIEGALGVALVDTTSGTALGTRGDRPDFDVARAALGTTEVMRIKARLVERLGLPSRVEEVLTTLETQYHLLFPLGGRRAALALYLIIDRARGNLALARRRLLKIEAASSREEGPALAEQPPGGTKEGIHG